MVWEAGGGERVVYTVKSLTNQPKIHLLNEKREASNIIVKLLAVLPGSSMGSIPPTKTSVWICEFLKLKK